MSDTQKDRPSTAVDKQTEAQIASVEFAEPLNRNAPANAAVDIVLTMTDRDGETQVWRAEYSNSYGTGNNASRTRAQMCVDALASIGWKNGHDFTDIDTVLVGRVVPISVRWTYSENSVLPRTIQRPRPRTPSRLPLTPSRLSREDCHRHPRTDPLGLPA